MFWTWMNHLCPTIPIIFVLIFFNVILSGVKSHINLFYIYIFIKKNILSYLNLAIKISYLIVNYFFNKLKKENTSVYFIHSIVQ